MIQKSIALMLVVLLTGASIVYARPVAQAAPPIPVDEIIKRFSEKEKAFRAARANYTYRQVVSVEELTPDDRVRGKFEQTSDIGFDGILLSWVDYLAGLECWNSDVMPLLEQAGLRQRRWKSEAA